MIDKTARALAARGLTLCEHYLMCTAGHRIPLAPAPFIATTQGLTEGDPRGECTLDELGAALDRLLGRGWMTILDPSDIAAEAERRAHATIPELFDGGYRAGHVDLTPAGHDIHREVLREIFGDEHLALSDRGFHLDEAARRFDVYATRADLCAATMDALQSDGASYTGTAAPRFIERIGPSPIGPWRPNRFHTLPHGHHGVLRYIDDD